MGLPSRANNKDKVLSQGRALFEPSALRLSGSYTFLNDCYFKPVTSAMGRLHSLTNDRFRGAKTLGQLYGDELARLNLRTRPNPVVRDFVLSTAGNREQQPFRIAPQTECLQQLSDDELLVIPTHRQLRY